MTQTVAKILRTEGVLGFYSGISASLLRQLTYATVRFAIYEEMKQRLGKSSSSNYGDGATVLQLIAMASVSGFVGGVAGNFADVLNVRMQHDAALPLHEQRRYKHALDGMVRMAREEGLGGWFRGWLPNSGRAAVQTASQLACYDIAKRLLLEYTPMRDDALPVQLSASFLAGLTAATVTNPIDVVKTRMMSSSSSTQKQNNIRQLLKTLFRTEGVAWMLKGWVPSFLHQGP
jgi:dicarboxylate transporter 10